MICSQGRSMTILIMQTEKNDYSHYFEVLKSNKTTLKSCHLFLQVELSFRTFSNDGLLVYGGSGGSGTDYFSIKLEDGHLVFEYELGGGPVVLKSAARYLCTVVSRFSGLGPSPQKCPLNRDSPVNRIIPI